jgi:hypothetical protein
MDTNVSVWVKQYACIHGQALVKIFEVMKIPFFIDLNMINIISKLEVNPLGRLNRTVFQLKSWSRSIER